MRHVGEVLHDFAVRVVNNQLVRTRATKSQQVPADDIRPGHEAVHHV